MRRLAWISGIVNTIAAFLCAFTGSGVGTLIAVGLAAVSFSVLLLMMENDIR